MEAPTPYRKLSWTRLAVTAIGPTAVFLLSLLITGATLSMLALLSAMGHGSLEWREAWPVALLLMGVGLAATAGATLWLERWTFGPRSMRDPNAALRPALTRSLSVALLFGTLLLGPWLLQEYELRSNLRRARQSDDDAERREAIQNLGRSGNARALLLIREIATGPLPAGPGSEIPSDFGDRHTAITALGGIPGGMEALVNLTGSPDARARSAAGGTLLRFAEKPEVWDILEALLTSDPDGSVRLAMTEALAVSYYQLPADRRARAVDLLRSRFTDPDPAVRLRAAARLSLELQDKSGYDSTLAIAVDPRMPNETRWQAMETLKHMPDPRTASALGKIVTGRYEPGFIPLDEEDRYRELAAEAMGSPPTYTNERAALVDVGEVMRAQFRYREENGFFEGSLDCLETPSECLPRYPRRDESLLRPALVALPSRKGYIRRFVRGETVAPEEIRSASASPTSVRTWAYVASPERPGETGVRGFCGDDTGRICFTADGSSPKVENGRCPDSDQEPRSVTPGIEFYPDRPWPCRP